MSKKQFQWQEMTVDEVMDCLKTNAAYGLSRKAARSRAKKDANDGLTDTVGVVGAVWFKRLTSSPLLLILAISALLAVFFKEYEEGVAVLLFFCFFGIFWSRILVSGVEANAISQGYQIPLTQVIREGKRYTVPAESVVAGDILLLRQGDLVPCLCRFIRTKRISVGQVMTDTATEKKKMQYLRKSAATVYIAGDRTPDALCENMAEAGSIIRCGFAKAVAVENAKPEDLVYKEPYNREKGTFLPESMSGYLEYLQISEIISLLFLLLNTFLALLILPDEFSILRIFLPICSLTLAGSSVIPTLYLWGMYVSAKKRCYRQKEWENRCVIRNFRGLYRMAEITDLVLLGHSALSDGFLHFDSALLDGKLIRRRDLERVPSDNPAVQAMGEALYALYLAKRNGNTVSANPYETLAKEWMSGTDFDKEGMNVRLSGVKLLSDHRDFVLEVAWKDRTGHYIFTDEDVTADCPFLLNGEGMSVYFSPEQKKSIRSYREEMVQTGLQTVSIVREEKEKAVLLGIFAVKEEPIADLSEKIEKLESSGVTVTAFLEPTSAPQTPLSALDGVEFCSGVQALDSLGRIREDAIERYRFFWGIPRKSIRDWMFKATQSGKKIAVIGDSVEDAELLSDSFLRISCDSADYQNGHFRESVPEEYRDTTVSGGVRSPDALRREADVILPRGCAKGGGLSAFFTGFRNCREVCARIRYFIPELLVLFLFRAVLFGFGLWSGIGFPKSFWVLWCGAGADLALYYSVTSLKGRKKVTASVADVTPGEVFGEVGFWFRPVFSAVLLSVLLIMFRFMGLISDQGCLSVAICMSLPLQLLLLLLPAGRGMYRPRSWKLIGAFLILAIPVSCAAILSLFFPKVQAFFGMSAWNSSMLTVCLVSFLLSWLVDVIATRKQ